MKKYIMSLFIVLFLVSCGDKNISQDSISQEDTWSVVEQNTPQWEEKIAISASIVPISSIVNTVGWDYVEVENIVPAGVSPHGFDLSAKQLTKISESEKVFMIGLEHIDGFLNKAVSEEKQVHLADGMELIEVQWHEHNEHEDEHEWEDHDDKHEENSHEEWHEGEHHEDEHEEDHHEDEDEDEHEDEHNHSADPHVWLGKDNIIEIAQEVRDELTKILPDQEEYFSQNTKAFVWELEKLYSDFEAQTEGKKAKEFIVFHDAYNYLMQSAGINTNLKVPFSKNVLHDTTTAHLAELIEEIQLHEITHAFTEPQFEAGNLQKLANDYNLTIGTLDPLGTNSWINGYLENLKNNLDNLSKIYE